MPAAISHWLLGQRIVRSAVFREAFPHTDETAFLWGCQGADILFFHRLLPWQRKDSLRLYGSLLHRCDPTQLLASLAKVCRYCRDNEDFDLIYAYALGFCCHYCYDRTLHPLVYYQVNLMEKTDERGGQYRYHNEIEANFDVMLLRHERQCLPSDIRMKDCLPQETGLNQAIGLVYSLLLRDMYGLYTPAASIRTLTDDFRNNLTLLDDACHIKKPLLTAAERVLPRFIPRIKQGTFSGLVHSRRENMEFDCANLLKTTWFNPADRSIKSNLNLFELTDQAQEETMTLMQLFAQAVKTKGSADFAAFTQGMDFGGRKVSITI